jgi:hypothetical protein
MRLLHELRRLLLNMAGYPEVPDTFRNGSALPIKALENRTDEESRRHDHAAPPGKWSIRQIARHVADTGIVVGVHPERGSATLPDWVRIFGVHVQTHVSQIEALRATVKQAAI